MTINMISERTELAHRVSGGIDVYLFWNEHTSRVTVGVLDTRGDESFEFEVDRGKRSTPSTIPTPTTHGGPTMHVRIDSPALTVPGALKPLQEIGNAAKQADIAETTLYLVELRASQINGCGVCVDIHSRELKHAGEPDERINTVAVWRDASYFTDAERAALALTEAATRLADRPDPVPDDVWDNAAHHYDETQLAALVLAIAAINAWNRLNVSTRQISDDWVGQWVASSQRGREAA